MYLLEANQDSDCDELRNNVEESEKGAFEGVSEDDADADEGCGATAASGAAGAIG